MTTDISSMLSFRSSLSSPGDEAQELSDVLQRIVQNAGALLRVSNCSVIMADTTSSTVIAQVARRSRGHIPHHTQLNEDVANWVAEHRMPLIVNDLHLDPRFKMPEQAPTGSVMCVPLIDHGTFIGTLSACSPAINAFKKRHLQTLTIFAEQAVMAINNAYNATHTKTKFLSMVTHELRSPLNTIHGYLDLILDGGAGELNEQQREFVRRARAGSEHLYALLEDLLIISRADAGQLRLNREEASLPEIVADAIEEVEITALDNGITITVDVDDDFPLVYVDTVRIQQVLRDLLSNSLRFTSSGGSITVTARLCRDASATSQDGEHEWVEIRVIDTGCGMEPQYQQRIFERFYQIPRASGGRASGQGLGLTIVRMIVELHGGQVTVESAPGQGSAFAITLPCLLP